MKKEKMLYTFCCAFGSGLIGFFANKLDTVFGTVMFTFGITLLVYSIFNLSRSEKTNK